MDYSKIVASPTPQAQPIFGREREQVKNNAGGFVFQLDKWARMRRFLVLGAEGGTYYAGERELVVANASCVIECAKEDAGRLVESIVDVSTRGLAPKNDPAIFALALACTHATNKKPAYDAITKVCRTGTHLFHFCQAVQNLRGWSRGLRSAVARWYTDKPIDKLEYQLVKYRQRDGWTHRDVMRLAHPHFGTSGGNMLAEWACGKRKERIENPNDYDVGALFPRVGALELLEKSDKDPKNAAKWITQAKLPWEAVPTELLNDPIVLDALFDEMPIGALVRQLSRFTKAKVIAPLSTRARDASARLRDREEIRKARLHPITILNALAAYRKGVSDRGHGEWTPVPQIIEALNDAFYLSFETIEPSGVPTVIGLDVSGSMGGSMIAGTSLSAREASAALAMVTLRTEKEAGVLGFTGGIQVLPLHARMSLEEVLGIISRLPFDRTDCALPMLWATANKVEVGSFAIYTDSETWCGHIHPTQALQEYRQKTGCAARSAVVGMTSTGFTIADPLDPLSLDVAGFSTDTPAVLANFAAGRI